MPAQNGVLLSFLCGFKKRLTLFPFHLAPKADVAHEFVFPVANPNKYEGSEQDNHRVHDGSGGGDFIKQGMRSQGRGAGRDAQGAQDVVGSVYAERQFHAVVFEGHVSEQQAHEDVLGQGNPCSELLHFGVGAVHQPEDEAGQHPCHPAVFEQDG